VSNAAKSIALDSHLSLGIRPLLAGALLEKELSEDTRPSQNRRYS
jgi:hypothetical protein